MMTETLRNKKAKFLSVLWPTISGILLSLLIIQQFPSLVGNTLSKPTNTTATTSLTSLTSYADAVRKASPSVVNIYTSTIIAEQQTNTLNNIVRRGNRLYQQRITPKKQIQRGLGFRDRRRA